VKNNTAKWQSIVGLLGLAAFLLALGIMIRTTSAHAGDQNLTTTDSLNWTHLSTANGDLPVPTASTQQVLTLIADIDNDGLNDFVIGSRRGNGPSLVWFHREAAGWTRYVIESDVLQMEAGGAYHDIDGDGDLDIVAGANAQTNAIWWWENPHPNHSAGTDWTRRSIKNSGGNKHHDMMFGNFDDDPATEFVFWNQNEKKLFSVDIPAAPLTTEPWPDVITVFDAPDNKREGLTQADIDGDGKNDIIGGGYWFKHTDGPNYQANLIEDGVYMRVAAGELIPGGRPEIVQVPGDADGVGRWFQWDGAAWIGHDLPAGTIRQGHSLELGDANADGNLDIFVGEMRFATGHSNSNPDARALLLLGDGQGNFVVETVAIGFGQHESRLADLDGDGDLDILGKPFTWDTPRLDVWLNNAQKPICGPYMAYWDTHVIDGDRPYRAVFVDAADVDGDGLQDIITGAWWYRNPGQPGGVWPRHEIGTPLNQMAVVADFDEDGDADILGTVLADGAPSNKLHEGSAFVWARNDGAGNFEILDNIDAGTGDFLQGAVLGTFNGSSREVMLSWHNRTDTVESLTIPSEPAAEQWTIRSATPLSQAEDLSTGDIDGDGDLDLLLGSVWLQNDGGNWNAHALFTTTDKPDRNRLADLNGDNRLDAIIGYEKSNSTAIRLAWYEAPTDPTQPWTERVIDTIVAPMSLDAGDMDGDGDIDIVAGEHNKSHPSQGRVFAYENQGGSFRQHLIATGDEHHDGTQLVDIDNDGDLDVVSIGWNHGRVLLYEHLGCDPETTPTHTPSPTPMETQTPTATPDVTETITVTPTMTEEPTGSPIPTLTPTATSTAPAPGMSYYFSFNSDGEVGGVSFADEDILRFDPATGAWTLFFDGSDVGLAQNNIDAFHIRPDGSLLFSTAKPFKPAGLSKFDDSDVLYFDPHSVGEETAGTFALHFDGSDVGLTTSGERIGGLVELPDGRLLISTYGSAAVPGVKAKDEDILLFSPASLGAETSGTWALYFNGSAIGLSTRHEDIRGIAMTGDNQLHLTMLGDFQAGEAAGGGSDVLLCSLAATGQQTVCAPPLSIVWHGSSNGLDAYNIDGLSMD
jgi:hypothetical protein